MVDEGGLTSPGQSAGGGTALAVAPPVLSAERPPAHPDGFTDP